MHILKFRSRAEFCVESTRSWYKLMSPVADPMSPLCDPLLWSCVTSPASQLHHTHNFSLRFDFKSRPTMKPFEKQNLLHPRCPKLALLAFGTPLSHPPSVPSPPLVMRILVSALAALCLYWVFFPAPAPPANSSFPAVGGILTRFDGAGRLEATFLQSLALNGRLGCTFVDFNNLSIVQW